MTQYDAIVIGAGHNGLVCAALMAKAGRKVLLLEASDVVGGLAASREFHPGFRASPVHGVTYFSASVSKKLDLARHGLSFGPALPTIGLGQNGEHIALLGDVATGAMQADIDAYPAYRKQLLRYAKVLNALWEKTTPRIGGGNLLDSLVYAQAGLKMRMLGREDMGEFVRILTLPMRDLVAENFEDPRLQALLSWDGLIGSKMAPRSPNNAVLPLLLRMSGENEGDYVVPKGGVDALVRALEAAAKEAGVDIRTNSPVHKIDIAGSEEGLKAVGVALESGEVIAAKQVISSADPKTTFFDLVGAENLEIQFSNRVDRLRTDGFVAKFHAALSKAPEVPGLAHSNGRLLIAPDLDAIEFAYDAAKHGEASPNPVMEITFPTEHDASLAPAGKHVLSANVMYAPYKEKTDWSDAARTAFTSRIIETIEAYAPGFSALIEGHELLTPKDLEHQHRNTGGHWHHGELALEQMMMMRPTYGAAQYQTPVPGVYLCGAGCHPGGGVMGAAGMNAARQVLA
ncbi:MAG: NAD(P)/FAD-dependent oxidoreductase [Pseudomonadota bacterium]